MIENDQALMTGMFWGGLLVAAVPMLLTLGIGIFVLRRHLVSRSRNHQRSSPNTEPQGRC